MDNLKKCKDCDEFIPNDKRYKRCSTCSLIFKKKNKNSKLAEWRRDIRDEAIRAKEGISLRYIQDRLSLYKSRAKTKKYPFDLDSNYLLELWKNQEGLCFYTKQKMNIIHLKYSFWSPSLDRLNPNAGYVKGNVVWALHGVNCFKQELTLNEFLNFVNTVRWPNNVS